VSGDILVSTGESRATGPDYMDGNAVISLTPDLVSRDFFAPSNWARLNARDLDLGSVGPAPVGRRVVFQIGKDGMGYLVSARALGGVGGEIYGQRVCRSAFGGTAFRSPYLYVPCSDGLVALRLNAARTRFERAWKGPQDFAAPPIVSGGKVWSLGQGQRILFAQDPGSGRVRFRGHIPGKSISFVTPAAGDGRLFMGAGTRIAAFSWR
jgi:hypothetical protein